MWFEKQSNSFRAWMHVASSSGVVRTGLLAGAFTVTVRDPADAVSTSPTVAESAAVPGLYYFDIPSAFLVANGVGHYGVLVEVSATAPNLRATASEVLRISQKDFDDLVSGGSVSTVFGTGIDPAIS